eukprot:3835033-Rhodomonas_salina.1
MVRSLESSLLPLAPQLLSSVLCPPCSTICPSRRSVRLRTHYAIRGSDMSFGAREEMIIFCIVIIFLLLGCVLLASGWLSTSFPAIVETKVCEYSEENVLKHCGDIHTNCSDPENSCGAARFELCGNLTCRSASIVAVHAAIYARRAAINGCHPDVNGEQRRGLPGESGEVPGSS